MSKARALQLLREHRPKGISNTHAAQEHAFWTLSQRVGDLISEGYNIAKLRGDKRIMTYRLTAEPDKTITHTAKSPEHALSNTTVPMSSPQNRPEHKQRRLPFFNRRRA